MSTPNYWVVIPAAGGGHRMGTEIPKQYLEICGKTILEHTLKIFWQDETFSKIVVALDGGDQHWSRLKCAGNSKISTVNGGAERCYSVFNALKYLSEIAQKDDWVLVHDAARPCLSQQDLNLLLERLKDSEVGGLLAVPVRDTLKESLKPHVVSKTVDRANLWQAQTPQMFRFGLLYQAISEQLQQSMLPTDESAALESLGYEPVLVESQNQNIKVTYPSDFELVKVFLAAKQ